MPVITFASPKGGTGKTTAALLLSSELAVRDFRVTVLDADPLNWISKWAERPGKPATLHVINGLTEDNILDEIEAARARSQFIITDLEGTASTMATFGLSRSDLVLIPIQPSDMDAQAGAMVIKLIRKTEQAFRTQIPFFVFLTKTKAAIRTRTMANIETQLAKARIPILKTALMEREAFRAPIAFGGTVGNLDPKLTHNVEAAHANAKAFAGEVFSYFDAKLETGAGTKEVA